MFSKKITSLLIGALAMSVVLNFYFLSRHAVLKEKLETPQEFGSYAIGYKLLRDLRSQGVQYNVEALQQGIQDALLNKSKYSYSDLSQFEAKLKDLSAPFANKIAEENKEIAKEFFVQNKSREGVFETPSGLQYRVQVEGTGAYPKPNDWVRVSYIVKYLDGQVYEDSKTQGESIEIPVTNAPLGMQEALLKMKPGSSWTLYVPPALGYGEVPRQGLPSNTVLVIELNLKEITRKAL